MLVPSTFSERGNQQTDRPPIALLASRCTPKNFKTSHRATIARRWQRKVRAHCGVSKSVRARFNDLGETEQAQDQCALQPREKYDPSLESTPPALSNENFLLLPFIPCSFFHSSLNAPLSTRDGYLLTPNHRNRSFSETKTEQIKKTMRKHPANPYGRLIMHAPIISGAVSSPLGSLFFCFCFVYTSGLRTRRKGLTAAISALICKQNNPPCPKSDKKAKRRSVWQESFCYFAQWLYSSLFYSRIITAECQRSTRATRRVMRTLTVFDVDSMTAGKDVIS